MAGINKILSPGSILFREGDESDGMYVIRRGKLLIFLDKGGHEIPLVTVGEGAMVGEMALFDKKPRSASARALEEVELTVIGNDDFRKIMRQIPKWFVTLMATLSTRLRDTNSKLEDLEARYKGNYGPIEHLSRLLNIFNLLWYKSATKELKSWSLDKESSTKEICQILSLPRDKVDPTLDSLVRCKLISLGKDSYKKEVFKTQNRGGIERFIKFVTTFKNVDPPLKEFPQEVLDMTEVLHRMAEKSAYEGLKVSLENLSSEGKQNGLRTENWTNMLPIFKNLDEGIQLIEAKDPGKSTFKVNKKRIPHMLAHCKILHAISQDLTENKSPTSQVKKQTKASA